MAEETIDLDATQQEANYWLKQLRWKSPNDYYLIMRDTYGKVDAHVLLQVILDALRYEAGVTYFL